MIAVLLYGHLAKQFGKRHMLEIATPAEGIRAMCANHKTFRAALIQDGQAAYRVLAGKDDRADDTGLHLPAGNAKTIKIIPVIAGSSGAGKILLGAALIGASFFLPVTPLVGGFSFSAASIASGIGFSLALGGVSSLLFSPPKQASGGNERPDNRPSYNFNGPVNTVGQGSCVSLAYGRIRGGSQVTSAGTETFNL